MLDDSDGWDCWICDRLAGFDFDLDRLTLTEEEVGEQLGRIPTANREYPPAHQPAVSQATARGSARS